MILLKHEVISELPVIELVGSKLTDKKLPTVFFYHGWESHKERVLEQGYSLAQEGFRVILPEAYNHGERQKDENGQNPLNFWEVVTNSVREFPIIVDSYLVQKKTIPEKIGVAGLSMGGITTSAILTQYSWVKAAVIQMGSPSPIKFTEWLLKNYKIDGKAVYDLFDEELIEGRLSELAPVSLNLQADKIAGRAIYFWHGTADPIVPAELTKSFVEANQNKDYAKNITLELTDGVGHQVPKEIVGKTSTYFKANL